MPLLHTGFDFCLCYFCFYCKNIRLPLRFGDTDAVTTGKDGTANVFLPERGIDSVDTDHFLAILVVYGSEGMEKSKARSILFRKSNGILQVKNQGIRLIQIGVF